MRIGELDVRDDIAQKHAGLFGAKSVNGRTLRVEELIAGLTRRFRDDFRCVLTARREFAQQVATGSARYGFLPASQTIEDADGQTRTAGEIRQGMLDNLRGVDSPLRWRLNEEVPIPDEVMRPGLQGTGPWDDLGMAMSAIDAHTASWMPDWEDAGNDYADKHYQAWQNITDLLHGRWEGKPFWHEAKQKEYKLDYDRPGWPVLFARVPGVHLRSRQISLDGEAVPAMLPALTIYALNNFDVQKRNRSGIYYYVPKIEAPDDARLLAGLLKALEEAIGVPRGTLKIEMLNERGRYSANQEAIMWVLRHWLVGPNVGRWDYINSRIEMGKDDAAATFPDPHKVGMTDPTMTAYTRRNALLTLMVGGFPVGGMSAVMKNPRQSREVNDRAVRSIWFDKLRERLTGLFEIDGKPYDTYRQSWVATTEPEYVAAGEEPLRASDEDLAGLVARASDAERATLQNLHILEPQRLSSAELTPDKLWSPAAWDELFRRPAGETTEEGLRYAIYMASEYMFQQLNGNNAAAIDDYLTGTRLMNDFATYEIFWHWLWTALHHQVALTQDGKTTKAGERVTPELMNRLLDERTKDVDTYFAQQDAQGIVSRFDRSKAPLVMDLLRRQLLHPRWITYGSRVLLSIIEAAPAERDAILEAVFSASPDAVPAGPAKAAAGYVYDM
jgi:malate synthase